MKKTLTYMRKFPIQGLGPYNMGEATATIEFNPDKRQTENAFNEIREDVLLQMKQEVDTVPKKEESKTPLKTLKKQNESNRSKDAPPDLAKLPWKKYDTGIASWIFTNQEGAELLADQLVKSQKATIKLEIGSTVYNVGFSGRDRDQETGNPLFITRTPVKKGK